MRLLRILLCKKCKGLYKIKTGGNVRRRMSGAAARTGGLNKK